MLRSLTCVSVLVMSLTSAHAVITAKASWDGPGEWERTCTVAIENTGDTDTPSVRISFESPKYPIPEAGITVCNKSGQRWYTYMLADLLPLKMGETRDCKIKFNFTDGKGNESDLPSDFIINGQTSPDGSDVTPPTVPQDLSYSNLKPYSFTLKWGPSTDDYGVAGYTVSYKQSGTQDPINVNTDKTIMGLKELLPDTDYNCQVRAFDFSSNFSDFTEPLTVRTTKEPDTPPASTPLSAPYIDCILTPTPDSVEMVATAGTIGAIVGFLSDYSGRPCWGGLNLVMNTDTLTYEQGDATVSNYFREFFSRYPDSIISMGGVKGLPIAANTDLNSATLTNLYASVLDNYGINAIDFCYIDSFLTDTDALSRDAKAVQQLITNRPGTKIIYTLPVDASDKLKGFNQYGRKFLEILQSEGIFPTAIHCFLSDFGEGAKNNQLDVMKDALVEAHKQLMTIFGSKWNDQKTWEHMGACPWFGEDGEGKVFSVQDQDKLNQFCQEKGMPIMSGWNMVRDTRLSGQELGVPSHQPYDFSKKVAEFVTSTPPKTVIKVTQPAAPEQKPEAKTVAEPKKDVKISAQKKA